MIQKSRESVSQPDVCADTKTACKLVHNNRPTWLSKAGVPKPWILDRYQSLGHLVLVQVGVPSRCL